MEARRCAFQSAWTPAQPRYRPVRSVKNRSRAAGSLFFLEFTNPAGVKLVVGEPDRHGEGPPSGRRTGGRKPWPAPQCNGLGVRWSQVSGRGLDLLHHRPGLMGEHTVDAAADGQKRSDRWKAPGIPAPRADYRSGRIPWTVWWARMPSRAPARTHKPRLQVTASEHLFHQGASPDPDLGQRFGLGRAQSRTVSPVGIPPRRVSILQPSTWVIGYSKIYLFVWGKT